MVIVTKYLEFKLKTKKKVKITTVNILSQIVTQDISLDKFIQFTFLKIKIREIKRETCLPVQNVIFLCLRTNKKHFIPKIMKL